MISLDFDPQTHLNPGDRSVPSAVAAAWDRLTAMGGAGRQRLGAQDRDLGGFSGFPQ